MNNDNTFGESFITELTSIGQSVDKWPEWKKQGWAIIDLPRSGEVIALRDGFYARIGSKLYGPWPMREYAQAGLAVELRRIRASPYTGTGGEIRG